MVTATAVPEALNDDTLNVSLFHGSSGNLPIQSFGPKEFQNSGAANAADFLVERLINASFGDQNSLLSGPLGRGQEINLRGFGSGMTLVLIDGHTVARLSLEARRFRPISAWCHCEAIERIDVLPSTAAASHGPNGLAGVINIVLKRDYTGLSLKAHFERLKHSSAKAMRAVARGGHSFDDRLSVSGLGSIDWQDPLFPLRAQLVIRGPRPDRSKPSRIFRKPGNATAWRSWLTGGSRPMLTRAVVALRSGSRYLGTTTQLRASAPSVRRINTTTAPPLPPNFAEVIN